jgi:hypothetical protein
VLDDDRGVGSKTGRLNQAVQGLPPQLRATGERTDEDATSEPDTASDQTGRHSLRTTRQCEMRQLLSGWPPVLESV